MAKIKKLIWTKDGIKSFEEVIQYISKDSFYYASNFAKKVLFYIEKLKHFPNIGRIVPEYNEPDIRELIYQNYRIVYKVDRKIVYVLLVIHGTRELQSNVNRGN